MSIADITKEMFELSVPHMSMDEYLPETSKFGRFTKPKLRYIININMFCSLKKYLNAEDLHNPEYECEVNFHEI
jgi:hypothetical protein